jgi:NAD-dependent deacetylase sirtuin 2
MSPPPVDGLPSVTLAGIASYLLSESCHRIVICQGAGVSVAAGIPDFRTPGTGLYDNVQQYNLPYPEAAFDIGYFPTRPEPFYELSAPMLPGKYRPTLAHYFGKLIYEKGLLHRLYTQNIDGLERVAGVPGDAIVEAHGTFYTMHCLTCRRAYQLDELRSEFESGKVVRCKTEGCNGLVKPDVVFFGEGLPERYHDLCDRDLGEADLLIVIGTALAVQPFASLIGMVGEQCPRLLINRDKVATYTEKLKLVDGAWAEHVTYERGLFKFDHLMNDRDVWLGGDLQEGVRELVRLLGWENEFAALLPPELREKYGIPAPVPEA